MLVCSILILCPLATLEPITLLARLFASWSKYLACGLLSRVAVMLTPSSLNACVGGRYCALPPWRGILESLSLSVALSVGLVLPPGRLLCLAEYRIPVITVFLAFILRSPQLEYFTSLSACILMSDRLPAVMVMSSANVGLPSWLSILSSPSSTPNL